MPIDLVIDERDSSSSASAAAAGVGGKSMSELGGLGGLGGATNGNNDGRSNADSTSHTDGASTPDVVSTRIYTITTFMEKRVRMWCENVAPEENAFGVRAVFPTVVSIHLPLPRFRRSRVVRVGIMVDICPDERTKRYTVPTHSHTELGYSRAVSFGPSAVKNGRRRLLGRRNSSTSAPVSIECPSKTVGRDPAAVRSPYIDDNVPRARAC